MKTLDVYSAQFDVCVCVGMFGLVFGLFGMLAFDGERVTESGMFQGYNTITWTVVALQVTLTPLQALVVKYIVEPLD